MRWAGRIFFTAAAICFAGAIAAQAETVSRFEPGPCAVQVAGDERIDCGVLVVPENRSKPGSRTIRLAVTIFRARSAAPLPDPIVFIPGGPGVSGIEGRTTAKRNALAEERDNILLEMRGNKHAQPSLACPEFNTLRAAGGASEAKLVQAATACRAALTRDGTDLDGYNSAEAADDFDDLRRALGVKSWNLIGLSYGTKLVLTIAQRHPEGVRSVVLDSVLPPEVNYDEVAGTSTRRSLDALFGACAADPFCSAAHPDLAQRFALLVARIGRDGLQVAGRTLGAREFVEIVASMLETPSALASLPRLVDDAGQGRFDLLQPRLAQLHQPSSFNWGLRLSVWCSEEMPFENEARMQAQVSPKLGLAGLDARTTTRAVCAAWNVAPAAASANQPVQGDVRALVFGGEFDPVTPPHWGRRLLSNLPNARFVLMPGQSHGASFNRCGGEIVTAFLRDPAAPLAADCVAKLPVLDFAAAEAVR